MTFKKGESGNPNGRPIGSENKSTNEIREMLKLFISSNMTDLQINYNLLSPKEKFSTLEKLLKYVIPTKVDNLITKAPVSEFENWTDEEIKMEIERLSK
jgi:hypothetical protein